jgi:NADH-quinone oxidoreductase subunit C
MTNKFQESFNNIFKKYNSVITIEKGDFVLETDLTNLQKVLFFLRDNEGCLFKTLIDILVVDYPEKDKRFCIIYCLLSLKYNVRIE